MCRKGLLGVNSVANFVLSFSLSETGGFYQTQLFHQLLYNGMSLSNSSLMRLKGLTSKKTVYSYINFAFQEHLSILSTSRKLHANFTTNSHKKLKKLPVFFTRQKVTFLSLSYFVFSPPLGNFWNDIQL